jgi:imidazolonepropionase-like amidohydrolase
LLQTSDSYQGSPLGFAQPSPRTTTTGLRQILLKVSAIESAQRCNEVSFPKALHAGVKIVFGTDIGGIPWSEPMAQEFPRMVDLGMAPMDAIKSATSRAAEMLEMQGQIGVLAAGAYADIIAVDGDPLRDIKILQNVQFVMKDGMVFRNGIR